MSTKQTPTPHRTYELDLAGELVGHHVTMGAMSTREIVAIQRGTMNEGDVLEMVASRCIAHDFDAELLDLDYWIVGQILDEWGTAMNQVAVPPQNGAS